MRVIVTDAHLRQCRVVVQSLGRRGIDIAVAGERNQINSIFYSKYVKKRFLYTSPDENEEKFIETMLCAAEHYDVLIPIHERTIIPIAKNLKKFKKVVNVPIPEYNKLESAIDKAKTLEIAKSIGVPIPKTLFIKDINEIKNLSKHLNYPIVIKLRKEKSVPPPRYMIAYSPKDFQKKYAVLHKKNNFPLVQQYIEGVGYGFFSLFDRCSNPLAIFCHKRIREYPITGGQSTYAESTYDSMLIRNGLTILKELKWYGVAMVEFRRDIRDGQFKLMEINPRFWGTSQLAINSGVDFPYLLCCMAIGNEFTPVTKYTHTKIRFLQSDTLALLEMLHRTSQKFNQLKAFITTFFDKNILYGSFSLVDFAPFVYEFISKVRHLDI